jgi:hypothetical protein
MVREIYLNAETAKELLSELDKPFRRNWVNDCEYCRKNASREMMPLHDASPCCQSGKHNHCTCDTCF